MRSWNVGPGETIIIPQGSECMVVGMGSEVWYNPIINKSYKIIGATNFGWQIIEYNGPLCSLCQERRRRYLENGF